MKNECEVLVNDKVVFSGKHIECCDFITKTYSPEIYDIIAESIDIMYDTGRLASFNLEW